MELFLNLSWLAIALTLGVLFLISRRKSGAASPIHGSATACLSYLVLIAMLLPVISMTDDLIAMVAPTDGEQIARRYEVAASGQFHAALHCTFFHSGREVSRPLMCTGRFEAARTIQAFPDTPIDRLPGRAPPAAA